jgi:hypothetical protein
LTHQLGCHRDPRDAKEIHAPPEPLMKKTLMKRMKLHQLLTMALRMRLLRRHSYY